MLLSYTVLVHDIRVNCTASPNQPIKCTALFTCAGKRRSVYSGSLLSPALCAIMCSRVMCPSSTQTTQPLCLSHFRLSLQAALQRDELGWSTLRRFVHSQIRDMQMPDNVRENCHLYSYQYYFLVNTSEISYLLSLDVYFRLINYNSGMKASASIHDFALAALRIVIIIKKLAC
jgi:hypothetical protein